ncbi:MAG: hypothetical protein OEY67_10860, partial [Gammaproteobacteria bacterium]|nr:hypothetical protein [Gammaproteobacteria bacterium]
MSHFRKKILVAAILGAAAATPTAVLATNGYFAHGYGTKNKGLVGAGVALPQDSMAAATNPAGMVMVGDRMDVGLAIFSPSPRSYEASQPPGPIPGVNADGTKVESENDFFLIPHFARNWMLDDKSSVGVTVYGNGGMNTKWKAADTPGGAGTFGNPSMPFNAGDAGVDLMQLFIATTYAQKIDDKSAWGASLILAHQRFEATGLTGFGNYSADPANISDNGVSSSTGFGVKLGIQSEVSPGVTVAASYQSQMSMGEFDEYAGLFADGGSFDIPATATIGLAWETSP